MTVKLLIAFCMVACSAIIASAQVKSVTPAEAKAIIEKGKVQVVDVRTSDEWARGHLVRAKHIDVNSTSFQSDIEKLDSKKPVLVYCAAGGRSARAADIMVQRKFKFVYTVSNGGYRDLVGLGLATSTE